MAEFATLTCPSCGAKLQVSNDLNRFACAHCGNEHVVNRNGGVVSLSPVVEELKGVRAGVDKTASELAIRRLKEEIADLHDQRNAIKGAGCIDSLFSRTGCFGVIGVFILSIVITNVAWNMDLDGNTIGAVSFGVGLAVLLGIAIFMEVEGSKSVKIERDKINRLIAEKDQELNHHMNLVQS